MIEKSGKYAFSEKVKSRTAMKPDEEIKEELMGKRLLILGGGVFKDAIKTVADTYGITLIAAGNNKFSDMFTIAQEKFYVNSTDADLMKDLIREQKIDGVFMGGSEPVIASACVYLQELGLPCYCTHDQWERLQDKKYFKELCIKHALPVVPKYELTESNLPAFDEFPVITKPADSCGSEGFSVCHTVSELKDGYQKAMVNSTSGEVVVERYVKNDAVVAFYTICDGKVYYSGLEDKYSVRYKKQGSYVGGLFVFDSPLAQDFREKYETEIAELVSDLGIREGNFWIEVFMDDGQFYFNEAGFRYGGSASVYPINYIHHINQVGTDIYYALTGKGRIDGFCSLIPDRFPKGKRYAIYSFFAHSGTICEIKGETELKENDRVVFVIVKNHVGETIQEDGTFSQVVALVHFLFDTEEELKETIAEIHKDFHMYDQDGKDMIYQMLNLDSLQIR